MLPVYFVHLILGTMSVLRSYVANVTTPEERTGCFALLNAFMATGFILGPCKFFSTVNFFPF